MQARWDAERKRGPTAGALKYRRQKMEARAREIREEEKERRKKEKRERGEDEQDDDDDDGDGDDDDDDDDNGDQPDDDDDDDDDDDGEQHDDDEEAQQDKGKGPQQDDESDDESVETVLLEDDEDATRGEQENRPPDDRQGPRHFVYRDPIPSDDDELQHDLEEQRRNIAHKHTSIISTLGRSAEGSEGEQRHSLESSVSPPMSPSMLQKLREIANMELEGIPSDQEMELDRGDVEDTDTRGNSEEGKKARLWWAWYRRSLARSLLRSPPRKWKPDPINMRKNAEDLIKEHTEAEKMGDAEWKDDIYKEIVRRRRHDRALGIFEDDDSEPEWTDTYTTSDEAAGARERGRRAEDNKKRRESKERRRARVPSSERTPDSTSVSPNSRTRGKPSHPFSSFYIQFFKQDGVTLYLSPCIGVSVQSFNISCIIGPRAHRLT